MANANSTSDRPTGEGEQFLRQFRNFMLPLIPVIVMVAWAAQVPIFTVGQYAVPLIGLLAVAAVYFSNEEDSNVE